MIEKTTGIVLRVSPFSRTSHVVVWCTRDFGRVTTVVKGSQRFKSSFLGQYDLFYSCELLFYSRDRNGVHIIRECSPIDTRTPLRHDWRAAVCASYFCGLVARVAPPDSSGHQFFHLLDTSLTVLCSGSPSRSFVSWFELHSMDAAGFSPRLSSCAKCGSSLLQTQDGCHFSCAVGGAMCGPCSTTCTERPIPVDPAVLTTMQAWQKMDGPEGAVCSGRSPRQLMEIEKILGMFLDYHVESLPTGRSVALELLTQK